MNCVIDKGEAEKKTSNKVLMTQRGFVEGNEWELAVPYLWFHATTLPVLQWLHTLLMYAAGLSR
jgi:hypothetical protein